MIKELMRALKRDKIIICYAAKVIVGSMHKYETKNSKKIEEFQEIKGSLEECAYVSCLAKQEGFPPKRKNA